MARGTSGFTGADLANLINQAALHGSAAGLEAVTNNDLEYARYSQDECKTVMVQCFLTTRSEEKLSQMNP